MKLRNILAAAALVAAVALTESSMAKQVMVPKMYMFGFAASFNDTIVHFTDIIEMDSAWIDTKSKFLLGLELYSLQLRNHLAEKESMPGRTTVVLFDKKRSKLEKKYLKMKRLYNGEKNRTRYDLRTLSPTEFRFQPVITNEEFIE